MELSHRFTVPIGVEETWAHFNDIASVAECFPGAQVTEADEESFSGSVKVKLGPIALLYNGSGTFVEKDAEAHRFVVDAKGKDKRGNGTAGAKVTVSMAEAERLDRRVGGDRPGHHRQAGAVRARGDAGRLRQAARAVRRLPRAAARRARRRDRHDRRIAGRRVPGGRRRGERCGSRRVCAAASMPLRRVVRSHRPRRRRRRHRPPHRSRRRGSPRRSTSAVRCSPCSRSRTGSSALAALVVLVLLRRLLRRS